MSEQEVIEILGPPVRNGSLGEPIPGIGKTLTYSGWVPYERYPMLWVHLDLQGRVSQVYAKVYYDGGVDDQAIYMRSSDGTFEQPQFETTFLR